MPPASAILKANPEKGFQIKAHKANNKTNRAVVEDLKRKRSHVLGLTQLAFYQDSPRNMRMPSGMGKATLCI